MQQEKGNCPGHLGCHEAPTSFLFPAEARRPSALLLAPESHRLAVKGETWVVFGQKISLLSCSTQRRSAALGAETEGLQLGSVSTSTWRYKMEART